MNEASNNKQKSKKEWHPIALLSIGVIVYVLLKAWVFPVVGIPS